MYLGGHSIKTVVFVVVVVAAAAAACGVMPAGHQIHSTLEDCAIPYEAFLFFILRVMSFNPASTRRIGKISSEDTLSTHDTVSVEELRSLQAYRCTT